jgi:hypothetical protein
MFCFILILITQHCGATSCDSTRDLWHVKMAENLPHEPQVLERLMTFCSEFGSLYDKIGRKEEGGMRNEGSRDLAVVKKKALPTFPDWSRPDAGMLLTYEIVNGKGTGEFVVEDLLERSPAAMCKDLIEIGDRVMEIDEVRLTGKSLTEANDLLSGKQNTVVGIKFFSFSKQREYMVRMVLKSHRSKLDWNMDKLGQKPRPFCPGGPAQNLSSMNDEERDRAFRTAVEASKRQDSLRGLRPNPSPPRGRFPESFRFL